MRFQAILIRHSHMKTMVKLVLLIPAILSLACGHKIIAEFKVTNHTPFAIDSLAVEPNVDLAGKYIRLAPDATHVYRSNMAGITSDGSYILSYKLNNRMHRRTFGYYANGIPLEYLTAINISLDSVVIVKEY